MNKGLPLYNCHKQVRAAKIKAISLGNEVACGYEYKGGAVCGYGPDEPMHNGTSSAVVPVLGRHDYKPERPSKEGEEFVGAILVPEDKSLGEIIVNHAYVRKHNPHKLAGTTSCTPTATSPSRLRKHSKKDTRSRLRRPNP